MLFEQIPEHQWPSGDSVCLMSLTVRIGELARTLPLNAIDFGEDGLGPECGCLLRLASGRVILILELQYAIEVHGSPGPTIQVDPGDAVVVGQASFAEEVRIALGLSTDQLVLWTDPETWLAEARQMLEVIESIRRARNMDKGSHF